MISTPRTVIFFRSILGSAGAVRLVRGSAGHAVVVLLLVLGLSLATGVMGHGGMVY